MSHELDNEQARSGHVAPMGESADEEPGITAVPYVIQPDPEEFFGPTEAVTAGVIGLTSDE